MLGLFLGTVVNGVIGRREIPPTARLRFSTSWSPKVVFESGGSSFREAGLIPGLAVYMQRYTPGAMYMGDIYWIAHSVFIALSTAF